VGKKKKKEETAEGWGKKGGWGGFTGRKRGRVKKQLYVNVGSKVPRREGERSSLMCPVRWWWRRGETGGVVETKNGAKTGCFLGGGKGGCFRMQGGGQGPEAGVRRVRVSEWGGRSGACRREGGGVRYDEK